MDETKVELLVEKFRIKAIKTLLSNKCSISQGNDSKNFMVFWDELFDSEPYGVEGDR